MLAFLPPLPFFSLDAASRLAVIGARLEYGLRYFVADALCQKVGN